MTFPRFFGLNNDVTVTWLPAAGRPDYERLRLVIAPGAEHASSADEWADALVLLVRGRLELECLAGSRQTFEPKAMLCLAMLPLRVLRNTGAEPVELVAIRRARSYHEGQC